MRVRVGPSPMHHLGLFATRALKAGTRIVPYQGAKIAQEESTRRFAQGNVYIFVCNDQYDIHGQPRTNTARSINHSCEPNCTISLTTRTMWIVAAQDIAPGEELTSHYGYGPEQYDHHPCHCGAMHCCGSMLDRQYWHSISRHTCRDDQRVSHGSSEGNLLEKEA
jgi:SET domain-containing protein